MYTPYESRIYALLAEKREAMQQDMLAVVNEDVVERWEEDIYLELAWTVAMRIENFNPVNYRVVRLPKGGWYWLERKRDTLSDEASVGDAIIGEGTVIGVGTTLASTGENKVTIGRGVIIGRDCNICDSLIETNSVISDEVVIREGCKIGANCNIGRGTVIDADVELAHDVSIGEWCKIGRDVHIESSVNVRKGVVVGNAVYISVFSVVDTLSVIGDNCIIGEGIVVGNKSILEKNVKLTVTIPDKSFLSNNSVWNEVPLIIHTNQGIISITDKGWIRANNVIGTYGFWRMYLYGFRCNTINWPLVCGMSQEVLEKFIGWLLNNIDGGSDDEVVYREIQYK